MPNTGTLTGLTASTEYILDAVHVDSSGNVSAVVSSSAFTTNAASTVKFSRIPAQISRTFTASPSFTVDLSGAVTGDRVVIWYGSTVVATAITLAGQTMTQVNDASRDQKAGQRISCYEVVLTADGGASETLAITTSSTNQHLIAGVITNRVIDSASTDIADTGADLSLSVTPSSASNDVVAVAIGESGTGGFDTWVGVTEQDEPTPPDGNSSYIAVATADDVAASATTIGASPVNSTGASSEDSVLSVIVLEDAP